MNLMESFVVKPPSLFFDHSQIVCWMKCSPSDSSRSISKPQLKLFPLPKQYIWNEDSAQIFLGTLKMDEFQSKISLFEQTDFVSDNEGVELVYQSNRSFNIPPPGNPPGI